MGETMNAGFDARWPVRAYHVARLLESGPKLRSDLATLAATFLQKSLVEDLLCAMENDDIVTVTTIKHLTRGERMAALRNGIVDPDPIMLSLSAKGLLFLATHEQCREAGACPCVWCAELAEIRAWAATPGELDRATASFIASFD